MSTTLTQLINLLTRPLIFTHPAITAVQLQLALQANLSTLFNTQAFAPFTLYLSAHTLPVPQIYAACLSLGLNWKEWVVALSGGKDLYILVMEGCIRVGVPGTEETVVVWEEEKETKSATTSTTTASKLQAMVDSARARKQANADAQASIHTVPTLHITPSTPSVTSLSEPSSPISVTSTSSSSTSSSSDSDADSDSDSDSDTESTFSSHSSQSSQSSVSSSSTKACSNAFGTPFLIPTTTTTTTTTTWAISRAQRRREWVAQASTRTQNKTLTDTNANAKVNATITKYTYQGGQTGVMTGGVMLGGKGVVAAATAGTSTTAVTINRKGTGSGSSSANWRSGSRRI